MCAGPSLCHDQQTAHGMHTPYGCSSKAARRRPILKVLLYARETVVHYGCVEYRSRPCKGACAACACVCVRCYTPPASRPSGLCRCPTLPSLPGESQRVPRYESALEPASVHGCNLFRSSHPHTPDGRKTWACARLRHITWTISESAHGHGHAKRHRHGRSPRSGSRSAQWPSAWQPALPPCFRRSTW